jgi:hypothetical protein
MARLAAVLDITTPDSLQYWIQISFSCNGLSKSRHCLYYCRSTKYDSKHTRPTIVNPGPTRQPPPNFPIKPGPASPAIPFHSNAHAFPPPSPARHGAAPSRNHGGGSGSDSDADGGDATTKPDLRARGLVAAKLWCLAVVFAGTLAGGVSPYFMRWNEAFLALGTQFAGGVFLGTALMHFLSDADETFGDLLPDSGYPYAFMLACAGYVVTMLADCVIAHVVSRGRHDGVGSAGETVCHVSLVVE